ncbi:hydrogenase maturation nickel metallochaperone HypA [bacterium]|nr:hydrogenase maturation nickel metallochaperone HypA [bacterium]
MHEVALAQSILDIATETARKNKAKKVVGIGLRIGKLSCVNLDSLQFAFSCISCESLAEGAELRITHVEDSSDVLRMESIEVND